MPTWSELQAQFDELRETLRLCRIDYQWGAAGIHYHVAGGGFSPSTKRFEALAEIAGAKLSDVPAGVIDASVFRAADSRARWYEALRYHSGAFRLAFIAQGQHNGDSDAGSIYTGSLAQPADASAVLALRLSPHDAQTPLQQAAAPSAAVPTRHEKLLRRLYDNAVVSIVLVTCALLLGIAALTGALDDMWEFTESRILGRSKELRTEYCELIRPLIVELDRTKVAFDRWDQKDLSLESETIRDGNLRARGLLREKGHLVPDILRDDQRKLISHYDQWLEEYDRVRVRRTSDPDAPFVFVYSFPRESEDRFRERMSELERKLGDEPRCR